MVVNKSAGCLCYRIAATEPATGELDLELELKVADCATAPDPEGRRVLPLFLPVWTPGSYLVREYSRHLSRVTATDQDGRPLTVTKTSKNRFAVQVPREAERISVRYRVYAHELSVRTADVTGEHAYWNHACLLLWPVERPRLAAQIAITFPANWDLACPLPLVEGGAATSASIAAGMQRRTLRADDLDHAIDSPCVLGTLEQRSWVTRGVRHTIAMDGLAGIAAPASLVDDLARIVECAADVFGGQLPYPEYQFLCLFAADGHGGLEHRDSTTLLMARTALTNDKGYRDFLGLAAHELFHAWNVKRLRPAEFWTYDYENENYTRFLWLIEGWTAYYDDLLCLRSGALSPADYLGIVAKNIQAVLQAPGRLRMSLAESSFDAWIRLYRPDENTRNSSQNYYVNGAVAALAFDLLVRRDSAGARSLDDVLRHLWAETFAKGRGYTLADIRNAVLAVTSESALHALLDLTDGNLDPALAPLLASHGIRWVTRDADKPFLGLQFEGGSTVVASVATGSPAQQAGLQPGDEVLAIQNLRVDTNRWQDVFQAVARVEAPLELLLARRGVVQRRVAVPARSTGTVALEIDETAPEPVRLLRDRWLQQMARVNRPSARQP